MRPRIPVLAASLALVALAGSGGVSAQSPAPVDLPHPAHIHDGVCPQPGDVVYPLNDLVTPGDETVGVADTAIPVEISSTVVEAALTDIVSADRAINVHESADNMGLYIACGDVGGPMLGGSDLTIGLSEQNGSGHHGVAWLHDNGDGTTRVDVILLTSTSGGTGASMAPAESMAPAPAESIPPAPAETTEPAGTAETEETTAP